MDRADVDWRPDVDIPAYAQRWADELVVDRNNVEVRAHDVLVGTVDAPVATVRGERAHRPYFEDVPWDVELPFAEPPHVDEMHLEEGTQVEITGVGRGESLFRKFYGYFLEECVGNMYRRHMADDEVIIVRDTGAIVFCYEGDIVALQRDNYGSVILYSVDPVSMENKVRLKIIATRNALDIIWRCEDQTVPTREPFAVMCDAFEEVFAE